MRFRSPADNLLYFSHILELPRGVFLPPCRPLAFLLYQFNSFRLMAIVLVTVPLAESAL